MKILVFGGTGAMGIPLVKLLSESNDVWVTSRSNRESSGYVHYLKGNAHEPEFVHETLAMNHWDAIVDFMNRGYENFSKLVDSFLSATDQYVFISSARVYAECKTKITEDSPRLLDVSTDKEFLSLKEYSLNKAKEENLLLHSGKTNFTIVRPSITYNYNRLQLGTLEKEGWLYRALHGRTIVFSNDLKDKLTTMTYGDDVSNGIATIIGRREAYGQTYHITSPVSLTWGDVLNVYTGVLKQKYGRDFPVYFTDKSTCFNFPNEKYRLLYCRYFDRSFDTSKISQFMDTNSFVPPEIGLADCLERFLEKPSFKGINWELEAINDKVTGEKTPLKQIPNFGSRLKYAAKRYNLRVLKLILKVYSKIK